ncbi:MAG: ROK family glucokinase [Clostridia bacterium]|nr:ROK family glucokinase [Clostridia bacterium]
MYSIGVDLGGTNIVAGVVDDNYRILATAKCKTNAPRSAELILEDMATLSREAVKKAGLSMDKIAFIGIGSPGTCNTETGVVEYTNNLDFNNVPICRIMHEKLGLPVYIENDANAAALGEAMAGAAKGADSCVCVTLGTGVGGGIILDGKIYEGFNFAGAEIGHTVIIKDGEPCTCGRNGCWEAYASATALVRQTKEAMKRYPASKMWQIAGSLDSVNGLTAFDAMRAGDEAGQLVVDKYMEYIACGVTNMINIFQPEVLCIGGGVSEEGETLLAPIRKIVEAERYSKYSNKQTKVCAATLGNDAGVIGAACLGR